MEQEIYSADETYISGEEQKTIDKFFLNMPEVGMTYTNEKGEQRRYDGYRVPRGARTPHSKDHVILDENKVARKVFVTPLCGPDSTTYLYYYDPNGGGRCTVDEWFKFLGKKFTQDKVPPKDVGGGMGEAWLATQKMKETLTTSQIVREARVAATEEPKVESKAS